MHVVRKDSSSPTKVRTIFDASAKSTSGVSLNDLLVVGPTVHPSLIDFFLRFRIHPVALTADVTKMYRAVELTLEDRDLVRMTRTQGGKFTKLSNEAHNLWSIGIVLCGKYGCETQGARS